MTDTIPADAARKPRRRWLTISLRGLILAIAVFAVGLASWVNSARRQRDAIAVIEQCGGSVTYDYVRREEQTNVAIAMSSWSPPPTVPFGQRQRPSRLAILANKVWQSIGEDYFQTAVQVDIQNEDEDIDKPKALDPRFWGTIEKLDRLESLSILLYHVENQDIEHLHGLTCLENLTLMACDHLTDAGLVSIARLRNLKKLDLSGTAITDDGLAALASLRYLQELRLDGTPITGTGLRHLAGLNQHYELFLGGPNITDDGLRSLADLHELRTLTLYDTKMISDDGLAGLAQLDHLETLRITGAPITDEGLAHLVRLDHLVEMDLFDTHITGEGLRHLDALGSLRVLSFDGSLITDTALEHVAKMPGLQELSVSGTRVTSAGIAKLKKQRPNLKITQ